MFRRYKGIMTPKEVIMGRLYEWGIKLGLYRHYYIGNRGWYRWIWQPKRKRNPTPAEDYESTLRKKR